MLGLMRCTGSILIATLVLTLAPFALAQPTGSSHPASLASERFRVALDEFRGGENVSDEGIAPGRGATVLGSEDVSRRSSAEPLMPICADFSNSGPNVSMSFACAGFSFAISATLPEALRLPSRTPSV